MKNDFFAKRRELFAAEMLDNSVAVFFSGSYKRDIGTQFLYPFAVERNFYYFTGIARENMIFMISKANGEVKEALYIPPVDELWEIWNHKFVRRGEAVEISGLNNVLYTEAFEKDFAKGLFYGCHVKNLYIFSHYSDLNEPRNQSVVFAERARHQYPGLNIINCLEIMTKLRSSKDEGEIAEIQQAIDYTKEALEFMVADLKPGKYEYELKARFEYALALRNTRHRYRGRNALILHYNAYNYQLKDGDLLLMDLGSWSNWYCSDITRTYPVSGKFTQRQRELYDIVLEANEMALSTVKDGMTDRMINDNNKAFFAKALKTLKLIKDDADVSKYLWHSLGHPIGLDLHDLAIVPEKPLLENSVYTIEPAIYIPEEGIGIRIEDDIVIGKNGCRNLSENIIKKANDIENFMDR
jgi:Xaa-Pro aminopeptidase